jgi:alanine racemase
MAISRRTFLGATTAALIPGILRGQRSSPSPVDPDTLPSPQESQSQFVPGFDPWVEVLVENLYHNLREVTRLAGGRPVLAVVKNNAYGLGLTKVGGLLQGQPEIGGLAVVKEEEALSLRSMGFSKPILLMGMFSKEGGPELAEAGVHLSLFTPDAGERIQGVARALGRSIPAHVYLDTGMGRMGMPYREAGPWMEELAARPEVQLRGTFTELGEDPDFDPEQLRRFLEVTDDARRAGIDPGPLHAAASNGVFHLPQGHLDMVRPGIALFGSYPSRPAEERLLAQLKPAVRLCARVVRVALVEAGEGAGYGRPWIAAEPTWTATVPVGHTDGLSRKAVEGGEVLINGRTYPVIGGVSASHCIVQLGEATTGAEAPVQVGDKVILLGPDHPAIEPNNVAEKLDVSVYDLLMHLNSTLPRLLVVESEVEP